MVRGPFSWNFMILWIWRAKSRSAMLQNSNLNEKTWETDFAWNVYKSPNVLINNRFFGSNWMQASWHRLSLCSPSFDEERPVLKVKQLKHKSDMTMIILTPWAKRSEGQHKGRDTLHVFRHELEIDSLDYTCRQVTHMSDFYRLQFSWLHEFLYRRSNHAAMHLQFRFLRITWFAKEYIYK